MAGIAVNRSAEPGSLGICVDFDDRAELLAPAPRYLLRDGPLRPLQRRAGSPVSPQSRYVARLVRHGPQVCDPKRRGPAASAEAPKARSRRTNKSLIPSG